MENQRKPSDSEQGASGFNPSETVEAKQPEPRYSIYTKHEKWLLVFMIAASGLFSPLTANVYFPAIPTLSRAFNKPVELINLTVTMYMVFQAIAPMFFGTLADYVGRRLIYASCLLVLSVSCAGLALVPVNAYWLLLFLRCFQSAGSASTIALGSGVIGDIAEPAERGGFFSLFQGGPLIGPAIGPIIGGALAGSLGWRSIFWFLCIAAGIAFILIILFLPETLRAIVGDGSIPPPTISRAIIPIIGRNRPINTEQTLPPKRSFKNPFVLLKEPDITLLLLLVGYTSAVYYAVTATISTLFAEAYPFLNETQVGLCFLPIGSGMFVGTLICGPTLDSRYRKAIKRLYPDLELDEARAKSRSDGTFPIEQVRLEFVLYSMAIFIASVVSYGWTVEKKVHIAVPLILQFLVGVTAIIPMTAASTLCIDLVPDQSSSVAGCNNLVRGSLGATVVAIIDILARKLTPGGAFVLLGGICALLTPIIFLVIRIGPKCRAKRRARKEKNEQK